MVRTQIQITEKQAKKLKDLAKVKNVSVAEIIRQSIDFLLRNSTVLDIEEKKKRAIQAIGKFKSGIGDISENHDDYLGEAFRHEDIR